MNEIILKDNSFIRKS